MIFLNGSETLIKLSSEICAVLGGGDENRGLEQEFIQSDSETIKMSAKRYRIL